MFGIPPLRRKAHFCAISSTSGTATEVTAFSIITDYQKGIKYPIADFEITPDVAIVDPELADTMPKKLVAHTGMDAMTHAIEAYVSTANCDFTDPLALHAIEMIQATDLVGSYNGDMDKRDAMHNAQCLAGMAFSNALLGIVHSMAHKTGAAFADYGAHIIHGAANAMYLPKVIAFNAKDPDRQEALRCHRRQDELGRPTTTRRSRCSSVPARHERRAEHSALHRALRPRLLPHRAGLCSRERVPGETARDRKERHRRCLHRLQPAPARARRRWKSC